MTRQWLDHARKAKQTVSPGAADGTYAAGVYHVTELLPSFMNDTLNNAPEDQKVRTLEELLCNLSLGVNALNRGIAIIITITILLRVQKSPKTSSKKSKNIRELKLTYFARLRLES